MSTRDRSSAILLAACSWEEIRDALAHATEHTKGAVFELLAREYLQLATTYDFAHVWSTHGDVPKAVLQKLNLFGRDVTGIDLIAETRTGRFWAVQCKYHQNEKWSLTRGEATGLIAGKNRARGEFELGLICTTANGRSHNLAGEPDLEYLMGDVWRGLEPGFFDRLHAHLRGTAPKPPVLKKPRPHQAEALEGITAYFSDHDRGKVVMPCGTGKSLVGFWSAERLRAHRVLVAVPNLSLVRQLLKDWTEQSVARGRRPHWVVVCSDDSVADSVAARDLGVKVDTDPREVAAWFRSNQRAELSIAFTTYQSGRVLAEAAKQANLKFDLGIFDEAHRTAGREGAAFAHLLSDENVRVRDRVFMTATPRIFKGRDREDIISMDDPARYGGEAFKMSFLAAMDRGIIPNLTIVAVTVSTKEVERLLRDRLFVRLQRGQADEVIRAEDLVSALALRKAMKKYAIRHTLGFYSSRKRCRRAAEIQRLIDTVLPKYDSLEVFHVEGEMTAAERDSELRAFEQSPRALLTNVRVFVEGVDCPSMDAVIFADPRQSVIDIVQGVGRALRPFEGKEAGYAIIPTVVEEDGTPSDAAYEQAVRIACALGSEDEIILDYFAAIAQGKPWSGPRVFELLGDVEVGVKVDLEKINQAISVRSYQRTVEWRSFEEARAFVRSLGFKSSKAWGRFAGSADRPVDIPSHPGITYSGSGWVSFGDWIGTGRQHGNWRPFAEARAYARTLGLPSMQAWYEYARSGKKPRDIPSNARQVYRHQGWVSSGDWLGTDFVALYARNYRSFERARTFAQKLKLSGKDEWTRFAKSGRKPADIPANPNTVYRGKGWVGYPDWLGAGRARVQWRSFETARAFVRRLGLKSWAEWSAYGASSRKPRDIPAYPNVVYKDRGWVSFGDWLGTGRRGRGSAWRSFSEARSFVRALGLKDQRAWRAWAKSEKRPADIPASPDRIYRGIGWAGYGNWLGTGRRRGSGWRSFLGARAFVRRLRLGSNMQWRQFASSGAKPSDIPSNPDATYRGKGWNSWADWLGSAQRPSFARPRPAGRGSRRGHSSRVPRRLPDRRN